LRREYRFSVVSANFLDLRLREAVGQQYISDWPPRRRQAGDRDLSAVATFKGAKLDHTTFEQGTLTGVKGLTEAAGAKVLWAPVMPLTVKIRRMAPECANVGLGLVGGTIKPPPRRFEPSASTPTSSAFDYLLG
jgi:hypothetical protein